MNRLHAGVNDTYLDEAQELPKCEHRIHDLLLSHDIPPSIGLHEKVVYSLLKVYSGLQQGAAIPAMKW